MSLEKLKELQKQQENKEKQSNLVLFENLIAINIGVPIKEHFPKLKNADGSKQKDEKGNDKRSQKSDGWTYTFAEFYSGRIIKVVLEKKYDLELLGSYKISGLGYDIKSASLVFIELKGHISNF